jgi:aspartyl-tRNA(Asn)/glutamyl-tRNA(Gln) amidotransferase subunit C
VSSPNPLTAAEVVKVANLARLALTEEEVVRFTEQLGSVLGHAADISALDLGDLTPMAHPFDLVNVLRDDVVQPTVDHDAVLAAAPSVEDHRFKVGRILGEAP